MKTLKILDWPQQRFYSETHPFHRWRKQFRDRGLHVKCYHDHLHKDLKEADFLLIHSRYFDRGKNIGNGARLDMLKLSGYLNEMRKHTEKLIWFDASDSSGSSDFSLTPHVDVFLKKQLLKDVQYYQNSNNNLRIWLNSPETKTGYDFYPCPPDQLCKLKLGWNLGMNDYRYFGYKLSRLSNYLGYGLYPLKFSDVQDHRPLDLTFRGTIHSGKNGSFRISEQRNITLKLLENYNGNIASGPSIPKYKYWKELRQSKLSISPYGWGEICYRDFETFISGALLIKPSMEHIETYPDMFKPNETYIPVSWDMADLPEKLDHIMTNFSEYKDIAQNGQEMYKKVINDPDSFIRQVLNAIF
ncbi:MAG TPA: glycosyltransferase [Sphingobacteriaceae bacterium]